MAWFTPAELPENKYYIFGSGGGKKLAKASESVLLGQIPLFQSVRESGDEGRPAVLDKNNPASEAFMDVARNTARQLAVRNEIMAPTQIVKVTS
jgi:ATP-binding protein involved in chromosome partitioning